MTLSNLLSDASVWVTAYKALNALVFPFCSNSATLSTQVSNTGPMVLWFLGGRAIYNIR